MPWLGDAALLLTEETVPPPQWCVSMSVLTLPQFIELFSVLQYNGSYHKNNCTFNQSFSLVTVKNKRKTNQNKALIFDPYIRKQQEKLELYEQNTYFVLQ